MERASFFNPVLYTDYTPILFARLVLSDTM
jgi:hypothetical protein